MKINVPSSNLNNKIKLSADLTVLEKVNGPIDFSLESSRCSLDMKSCNKYETLNIKEACKKLTDKSTFFSKVLNNIQPPLTCPMMPGNYTIQDTELDLGVIAFLPLDGFIYTTILKLVSTDNESKTRKLAWCFKAETKIVKIRVQ